MEGFKCSFMQFRTTAERRMDISVRSLNPYELMESQRIKPFYPLALFLQSGFLTSRLHSIVVTLKPFLNRKSVVKKTDERGSTMSNKSNENINTKGISGKAKIRCIIEITQPDGNTIQVATDAIDALPALATTNMENREDFMDFINKTEKGILEVRNEAGKKAIEAYAQEVLKKTNPEQTHHAGK